MAPLASCPGRLCLLGLMLTLSASVAALPAGENAPGQQPNVILVITDDQGYGDVAAHGNTMIRTPHLDGLYKESVRLTDFHVSPCCTPTRAALMTGHDTLRTGAWGTTWGRSLPYADEIMMAQVFAAGGYRTGFFGKWHLGDNYPFRPQDRGFQEVLAHGGGGVGQTPDYWGNDYFDDTYFHNGKPKPCTGYCTDVWFRAALDFIAANKDRPFFVYLSTNAPHGPLFVDPKYSEPYEAKGVPPAMARFYGMIENIDENMGRLIAKLEEWSLQKNTVLIFMTDNGTATGIAPPRKRAGKRESASRAPRWTGYNAGMRGKKGSLYDGGHRVPCFIRWPAGGLSGGRDVQTLCAHVDLLPTLGQWCGLELPIDLKPDGRSLAPLLAGKAWQWPDRSLFVQYRQSSEAPRKWAGAVMTQRWRLVSGKELYDIQADPGQKTDVASQNPQVVERLRRDYEQWWTGVSKRFSEYTRIVLGAKMEDPVQLTAFDWHTTTPWNQNHIRKGVVANGFWAVEITRSGDYAFSLRRWPPEVDQPITVAIDGGKAIAATTARLRVGKVDVTRPISPGATAVTFRINLPAGPAQLQTWLTDAATGQSRGAYYVSVKGP